MKTDVLLADVFENFRRMAFANYLLDPVEYLTLPGYSWDACLYWTGVKLELIADMEMHMFIEQAIRGGVSVISRRYAKANNPFVPDYKSTKSKSYICYYDVNNLYGTAMSEPLPYADFKILTPEEISRFDLSKVADDALTGFILECGLEYPSSLHDHHNDYSLAPESMVINESLVSEYCKSFNQKHIEAKNWFQICSTKRYVLHYRNLKLI